MSIKKLRQDDVILNMKRLLTSESLSLFYQGEKGGI